LIVAAGKHQPFAAGNIIGRQPLSERWIPHLPQCAPAAKFNIPTRIGIVDGEGNAATYTGRSAWTGPEGARARTTRRRATSLVSARRSSRSRRPSSRARADPSPTASSTASQRPLLLRRRQEATSSRSAVLGGSRQSEPDGA
jgi:hypothetical protein